MTQERIYEHLKNNPSKRFTAKQISRILGIKTQLVYKQINSLHKYRLVAAEKRDIRLNNAAMRPVMHYYLKSSKR